MDPMALSLAAIAEGQAISSPPVTGNEVVPKSDVEKVQPSLFITLLTSDARLEIYNQLLFHTTHTIELLNPASAQLFPLEQLAATYPELKTEIAEWCSQKKRGLSQIGTKIFNPKMTTFTFKYSDKSTVDYGKLAAWIPFVWPEIPQGEIAAWNQFCRDVVASAAKAENITLDFTSFTNIRTDFNSVLKALSFKQNLSRFKNVRVEIRLRDVRNLEWPKLRLKEINEVRKMVEDLFDGHTDSSGVKHAMRGCRIAQLRVVIFMRHEWMEKTFVGGNLDEIISERSGTGDFGG